MHTCTYTYKTYGVQQTNIMLTLLFKGRGGAPSLGMQFNIISNVSPSIPLCPGRIHLHRFHQHLCFLLTPLNRRFCCQYGGFSSGSGTPCAISNSFCGALFLDFSC